MHEISILFKAPVIQIVFWEFTPLFSDPKTTHVWQNSLQIKKNKKNKKKEFPLKNNILIINFLKSETSYIITNIFEDCTLILTKILPKYVCCFLECLIKYIKCAYCLSLKCKYDGGIGHFILILIKDLRSYSMNAWKSKTPEA